LDFTKKLIDGKFFGLTHQGPVWYAFGTHAKEITNPSFKGYILQFEIDSGGNMINQKEILTGLDNGVHQMCIWKDHLYILETYIQQITILNLKDHSQKRVIHPFDRAISSWYSKKGYEGCFKKYIHANAITVQDDRFYVMGPHLKNAIIDGNPSQERKHSNILMFGPDWKIIDNFDTGRYFCHDMVIIGHEIYFSDATNTICKLNIVSRKVEEVWTVDPFSPDLRRICRGLSISEDGKVFVGTHDFEGNNFLVDVLNKKQIQVEDTPCCIKRIDGTDFNDETSHIKEAFVLSFPADFSQPTRVIFKELVEAHRESKRPGSEYKNLDSFLNPDLSSGKDFPNDINPSIVLPGLSNKIPLPYYLVESGPFYLYPQGHVINWHTNKRQMEHDNNLLNYRIYTVNTDGNSYFLYMHPNSRKIHAVKDIDGTSLVFNLSPRGLPFWHAVLTMSGSRLSFGVKFANDTLRTLGIEDIWGEKPETFRFIFKDEPKEFLGPKSIRDFLSEHEVNQLRTRLQDFNLTSGKINDENYVESIRHSKVLFLPKTSEFCNLYIKIFKEIENFNKSFFKFQLTEIIEDIQYSEYDESYKGHYDWHLDNCNNLRKLSIVIQLSDPSEYEGGELQVQNGESPYRICTKEKGALIVFPSFLNHRVTPVTKGRRRSLVIWISGPPFV
jgi:PKHD-type hydroxylase